MGTKCFNMYSTDDSLSIYKPASQGGSKNIYIGGNDASAPLKIVGNKVFINGVEYVPPVTKVHATATIALTRPVITAITVPATSQGSGYTTPPTVVFNAGVPPVGGTLATATVLSTGITAGKVITVTLNSPGSGYISPPAITFTGGGGTGAAAIATLTPSVPTLTLTSPITVVNGGLGYTSAPTVVFNDGVAPVGGVLATATATLGTTAALGTAGGTADKVINVTLTSPGTGYTSAPIIKFIGGGI